MSLPPGIKIPSFNSTLGALFIGTNISTILYGVICLQTFLYITSAHSQKDRWWLKGLVFVLFALDTAHQLTMTAAIYKFLISDFLNPLLIPAAGAGSGEEYIYASSTMEAIVIVIIQLFFCWRLWMVSMASSRIMYRVLFIALAVPLALLSFASSMDLSVTGFNQAQALSESSVATDQHPLTPSTPGFILAYKLSTSTRVAFDVIITIAMTIALHRARSSSSSNDAQFKRSEHVITLMTLFTVNTNLLTTLLSISELTTFLTLPNNLAYAGIAFLASKTYLNSFLAVLNSREYLHEKINHYTPPSTKGGRLAFAIPKEKLGGTEGSSSFQLSTLNSSNSKPNTSMSDGDIFGMNIQVVREVAEVA